MVTILYLIKTKKKKEFILIAKLQLHNRRSIRNNTRNCPICYQPIPINSDDEYFFTHVQQCSRKVNQKKQHTNDHFMKIKFFKREQLAAVTAIANHHRLPPPTVPVDDPDVNVVDIDDGNEREEKSTSGTTSLSCQESFNSDHRYSPSTQTDILYSKSPNVVPELDPPKCVVCMVRILLINENIYLFNFVFDINLVGLVC
jgi:hypothetical protein